MHKLLPALALVLSGGALSGCAIDGTPRLTAREGSPPATVPGIVTHEDDAPEQTVRLARALARELNGSAAPASASGAASLLLSTSRAPATLGMAIEGKPGEPVRWLSQPRRKGRFDACRPERLHARLASTGTGERELAVSGEVDFCRLDDRHIDALARTLAQALRGG